MSARFSWTNERHCAPPPVCSELASDNTPVPGLDGFTLRQWNAHLAGMNAARRAPTPPARSIHTEETIGALRDQKAAAGPTRCRNGHPMTAANTYTPPSGETECRTCRRAAQERRPAKRRPKDGRTLAPGGVV